MLRINEANDMNLSIDYSDIDLFFYSEHNQSDFS